MAEKTRSLALQDFAYVRSDHPTTHYTVNENTWYTLDDGPIKTFYGRAASMPASLGKYALLKGLTIVIPAKASAGYEGDYNRLHVYLLSDDYNAQTITFNTRPQNYIDVVPSSNIESGKAEFACVIDDSEESITDVANFLNSYRAIGFEPYLTGSPYIAVKASPTSGTYAARIIVNYDDSIIVTSVVNPTSYPSGQIAPKSAQTFSWEYIRNSNYRCAIEKWTQASAVLYWRAGTSGSYNAINISGTKTTYTVPAYTFPTGSTIYWYIKGTDTEGTTTQTSVRNFTTVATSITPSTYPEGNNIDSRLAQLFAWDFSPGGYTQSSAAIKWRVSGTSAWNTINVSGTTKSKSVPAYTFPAGRTIEWYLTGTDYSGASSSSSTRTFTTLAFTLTVTGKPNTSNVDTRTAQTFTWTLESTSGAVTQSSAVLYWRVSGTPSYTAITNSTSVKSISIPANTMPTASTIQWYLTVTAKDGTSYSTSPATFSTVSPQITATIYPSGSDIYSGGVLNFQWKYTSAVGDYTQTSAVFYWRKSTSDPWTAINVSGTSQSLDVPANTFPTNATIYWYLTGVDRGGHSSSTSATSFKTASSKITPQSGPMSGYYNPREDITFSWYFAAAGGSIPPGNASLFWKVSTDSTYTEVQGSGTSTSITIQANTFPVASLIDWYIEGEDMWGVSSTSDVYQFSTTASQVKAITNSPITGTVDGSDAITFKWTLTSADGFPASRVDLLWKLPSESSSSWHTIVSENSPITEYTVPADYFSAGQINWLVRAWNVDDVQGPDSIASVVVIVAPKITGLTATALPWSTISWQANEQLSFVVEVDGQTFGPYFGSDKHFMLPDYLRDGIHTIRVRVLGMFNMWSDWAELTISIENDPGETIVMAGEAGVDIFLAWSTEEETSDFYIYRDDVMIGHTTGISFTDRFSIGEHTFTVINRLPSGNYSISNNLTFETSVANMHIAAKDGGDWIELVHTLKSNNNPVYSESLMTEYNKITGHQFPAVSVSEYMDTPIECSAVFLYTEEEAHSRFKKLLGKPVIIKTKDGGCYVCFLDSWNRSPNEKYYTAYQFTLRRINWEDFIDDT